MLNFDLKGAAQAKDAGRMLTPGIKNATFKGITYNVIHGKNGTDYNAMSLNLDVEDYGEYVQNFFEPTSNERKDNSWGGKSASQLDHFLIALRQILSALDERFIEAMNDGKISLSGSFADIVKTITKLTSKYVGTDVQIKLLPQSNGFSSMPSFPAKIDSNGNLRIATYIIGHDLTLTPAEQKKIVAAENATPTNMASNANTNSVLSTMAANLGLDSSADDDLPF